MNRFDIYQPSPRLQPYVKHLVISESAAGQCYNVIPDTALVMGFQYKGKLSYIEAQIENPLEPSGITGLMDNFRTFKNVVATGSILVVFKEMGAAAFIRQPVNELFGESISLRNFFKAAQIKEVEEKLYDALNDKQRLAIVEAFLIANLKEPITDGLVDAAIQRIYQSRGTLRIADLTQQLNISQSPLEKRFRKMTGASPKKFASIVRARNVISVLDQGDADLSEYLISYYDQAHFIKDFKRFTSVTPEQYIKLIRRRGSIK